jgi:hypothetical protein
MITALQVCLSKVDFPPMLGPLREWKEKKVRKRKRKGDHHYLTRMKLGSLSLPIKVSFGIKFDIPIEINAT